MSEDPSLPPVTGGCLCGRVRYTARPTHREGYYCHCRMCQLATGSTRANWINLRKDQVSWTAEPPTYHASSRIAERGFCGRCGTPLSFHHPDSEYLDLTVGSLDDPGAFKPVSHYAIETRVASWHVEDGLPGTRLDTNERLAARWKKAYGEDVVPGPQAGRR
jgi:hypothetical protein